MELDRAAGLAGFVVADQVRVYFGEVGCGNAEFFVLLYADLRSDCSNRSIASSDIQNSSSILKYHEFVAPELPNHAIVVVGLAGAERSYEALLPESRPLLKIVRFRIDALAALFLADERELYS